MTRSPRSDAGRVTTDARRPMNSQPGKGPRVHSEAQGVESGQPSRQRPVGTVMGPPPRDYGMTRWRQDGDTEIVEVGAVFCPDVEENHIRWEPRWHMMKDMIGSGSDVESAAPDRRCVESVARCSCAPQGRPCPVRLSGSVLGAFVSVCFSSSHRFRTANKARLRRRPPGAGRGRVA